MVGSIIIGAAVVLIIQYVIPFVLRKIQPSKATAILEKNWKKDVVYVYQPPGTKVLPSVSPFCIKLETFLRLHKIPFERRPTLFHRGVNGKFPSVEFNGEHIADSELIIHRLVRHFNIKEYSNPHDASIGHAFTSMVDQRTFNIFFHFKITRTPVIFLKAMLGTALPESLIELLTPIIAAIKGSLVHSKIFAVFGEYSDADFDVLVRKDLVAYRDFLGQKKFLLGDTMTTADCAVFGHLSATFFLNQDSLPMYLLKSPEFANLAEYIKRVRDTVFGDEFSSL